MKDQLNKLDIRIMAIGDSNVGKTFMVVSYAEDIFPYDYYPILGNYTAKLKYDNKFIVLDLLHDFYYETGYLQESFPQSDVFLIVFSVTDSSSFENAVNKFREKWYPVVHQKMPDAIKLFAGNKNDLRDENNMKDNYVKKETAEKVIKDLGCSYVECSALTQDGLKEVFQESVRLVLKQREKPKKEEKNACCCCLI